MCVYRFLKLFPKNQLNPRKKVSIILQKTVSPTHTPPQLGTGDKPHIPWGFSAKDSAANNGLDPVRSLWLRDTVKRQETKVTCCRDTVKRQETKVTYWRGTMSSTSTREKKLTREVKNDWNVFDTGDIKIVAAAQSLLVGIFKVYNVC